MARDPVCGMDVDEQTAKWKTTHMGKTYYFCAPGYQKVFSWLTMFRIPELARNTYKGLFSMLK